MMIQAAVDGVDFDDAIAYVRRIKDVADITCIEVGSPMVTTHGIHATKAFMAEKTTAPIYVDLKALDFPLDEIEPHLALGAHRYSCLLPMENEHFERIASERPELVNEIYTSTMGYHYDRLEARVREVRNLGFRNFICHGAGRNTDEAFERMIEGLKICARVDDVNLIAAGGIGTHNMARLTGIPMGGIIVGRNLRMATDPAETARVLRAGLMEAVGA